ncbi:U6 snRNA phosphodiesterase-like [Gossypium australe]|uniref:U6 snRNA phosphodiesterase 1 n=1 Tax=Gossypium australe TaxID=47621 RepID=A0A5B6WR27_9ROSI|nr:U6 snRNA phosphodiesterase-like [Gossypium australe]
MEETLSSPLPPPPVSLLHPLNSVGSLDYLQTDWPSRVRSFLHIEVSSLVTNLYVVNIDVPLNTLCKEEHKLEQVALEREFHINLGRTIPIRVHD